MSLSNISKKYNNWAEQKYKDLKNRWGIKKHHLWSVYAYKLYKYSINVSIELFCNRAILSICSNRTKVIK